MLAPLPLPPREGLQTAFFCKLWVSSLWGAARNKDSTPCPHLRKSLKPWHSYTRESWGPEGGVWVCSPPAQPLHPASPHVPWGQWVSHAIRPNSCMESLGVLTQAFLQSVLNSVKNYPGHSQVRLITNARARKD